MINNLKVIAWRFLFDDEANIEYDRNIAKYILNRFFAENLVLRIEKIKVFNPEDYEKFEDLHLDLCLFYSNP